MGFQRAYLCLFFILLLSCQTSPRKAFAEIELGAKKGEVLAALGGPRHSYYKDGIEHWVYKIPDPKGVLSERELWLQNGIVVNKSGDNVSQPKDSDFEEIH
ncbi:MAG: hypothetical protein H6623_02930 [Bdellovibrionaceae bacterium]|nr:hypothetical protein [Pseudobdellovibrionaceae bacterium]